MRRTLCICIVLSVFLLVTFSFAGSLRIEQPSKKQITLIQSVLDNSVTLAESAAVKSSNHKNAYYIGVNFFAQGIKEKMTGIWLIGGTKNNPSMVLSVDGTAYQFSGMRRAKETKAAAYISDPESKLLTNHLK